MKRRSFLKGTGVLATQLLAGSILTSISLIQKAEAQTGLPLKSLFDSLRSDQAILLTAKDFNFSKYQSAFNIRTTLQPEVRALCQTAEGVSICINWCRTNNVPFAIRGAGHSYEGYSQSKYLVIDTRLMKKLDIDVENKILTVQPGLALGEIYKALSVHQLAIPAGSCPTVGVVGHTMGGGYGLLARAKGLACDSLIEIEIVDAQGKILKASENENADLFWACRGGGNGQFGVVTELKFKTYLVSQATTFGVGWVLPKQKALQLAKIWQSWAPYAPDEITSLLKISKDPSGLINLRCVGQSIGTEENLIAQLQTLIKFVAPTSPLKTTTMSFIESVKHFSGGDDCPPVYMKAKSDYLFAPMSDEGLLKLMSGLENLSAGVIAAIMDSYGGAINRVDKSATAFSHRENTHYSIQYYSEWHKPETTAGRLKAMKDLYDSMRPYVSGQSYVNYCDLDLVDAPRSYWGENLERLQNVKAAYDPENIFRHAQSILPRA